MSDPPPSDFFKGLRERAAAMDAAEEETKKAKILEDFTKACCTSEELESRTIVIRKSIMGIWLKEKDYGLIHGVRGHGKTFFTMGIAISLSTGCPFGGWEVPKVVKVLYVDGEMPADDSRDRLKGMAPGNKNLHILHHEQLFDMAEGRTINLTEPAQQHAMTQLCINLEAKVLILDNLSCLFYGMDENDASSWEKVLNWILNFRRRGICVILVHHSGKGGAQRGTSRREDALSWMIKVERVQDLDPKSRGAHFETTFSKQRNGQQGECIRRWSFQTEAEGNITIGCQPITIDDKVLQLIEDGIYTNTNISKELNVSAVSVSRAAQRLIEEGLIESHGREGYRILREGEERPGVRTPQGMDFSGKRKAREASKNAAQKELI